MYIIESFLSKQKNKNHVYSYEKNPLCKKL